MRKLSIENVRWCKDELGDYWVADLLENGKKIGVTGNYYDIDETIINEHRRPNKSEIVLPYPVTRKEIAL